jgi:hypothetical protein
MKYNVNEYGHIYIYILYMQKHVALVMQVSETWQYGNNNAAIEHS